MHIDPLESRTHFAATVIRNGNILTITGSDGADEISIAAGITKFSVIANERQWLVRTSLIKKIRIYGLGGNDTIVGSPILKIPYSIDRGKGNDEIYGGPEADSIWRSRGNDTIRGLGGSDAWGRSGSDYIDGGPGDDIFYGNITVHDVYQPIAVIHGGAGDDIAENFGGYFGTGVEYIKQSFQFGTFKAVNGKTLLEVNYNLTNFDTLEAVNLIQQSPGVYSVNVNVSQERDFDTPTTQTPPTRQTRTIDVSAAKGSKLIIKFNYTYWNGIIGTIPDYFMQTFVFSYRV